MESGGGGGVGRRTPLPNETVGNGDRMGGADLMWAILGYLSRVLDPFVPGPRTRDKWVRDTTLETVRPVLRHQPFIS